MIRKYFHLLIFFILLLNFGSCTPHWTKTILKGKTVDGAFVETVQTNIRNGLIIVPVIIGGNSYRFLFDTGAIYSISEEIQCKMNYKTISKGKLTDSDNNRRQVNYVQTDTILIGDIPFTNQTAFVADFSKNPIIECLEIDGIIGSNLMRHCLWKIDYQNAEIVLFKDTLVEEQNTNINVPFKFNQQFDQIITMKFGKATLKNLKIDYGSNGSLTLSRNSMKVLKENEIITKTFVEEGFVSSGLFGETSPSTREFAWADSLQTGDLLVEGVEIKSGKSGLIGGEILSRYVVTIDFLNKELSFVPVEDAQPNYETFGFRLACSEEKEFYIQACMESSPAAKAGLKPGFKVNKLDELGLTRGTSFCEYIEYVSVPKEKLKLEYLDQTGKLQTVTLTKIFIY